MSPMLKRKKWITWCAMSLLAASAVQSVVARADQQTWGTIIGGVIGGLAGSTVGKGNGKTLATVLGAGIGAVLGSGVGEALDENDRLEAENAYYRSLNGGVNESYEWSGSRERGNRGRFQTRSEFHSNEGYSCRTYVSESWINGRYVRREGTSCRYPDGSWREWERVDTARSDYDEVTSYTCMLRDPFGGRYVGHGQTRLDAEEDAAARCSQYRHPMYCGDEQRCESSVQSTYRPRNGYGSRY